MEVYLLHHTHELGDGAEDVKLIGVYSSLVQAEAARDRMGTLTGFSDAPNGFEISRYAIDEDHWTEGYVTVK